jgi:hypothetical protein
VLSLATALALLPVAISARRLVKAERSLDAANTILLQTARECHEMQELRTQSQTVESRQRPAQDVIAQVNAILGDVGIPLRHFNSLTPEAEATAASAGIQGNARLLQQSVRLALQDLSPDQIGAFLVRWQSTQKIWMPTRIELTHVRGGNNAPVGSGGEAAGNRYDATILFTALYLADAPRVAQLISSSSTKERP